MEYAASVMLDCHQQYFFAAHAAHAGYSARPWHGRWLSTPLTRCSMLPTEHQLRSHPRHEHRLSAAYMHRERQVGAPACTPAEVSAPASRVQLFIASFLRKAFDAPANSDPNTANEQILSNDAKSPKHSAQIRKTASLIESAVSSETESSSLAALPSDVITLACLSQHELSPSKQPRAGKSISKRTIYYDGREWEYKGYKWVKQGILSLRLMPVGSNEIIELVHERDVQLDNQKGLLELWKGIGRPKPKNRMYQPLRILDETEDEKFEWQWTGFDEESYSLEPVSKMWKVAPDLVEYYGRRTQGEASHAVKYGGKRPVRRPQLPPGPRRKRAHRPRARGGKGPSTRRRI